MNITKVDYLGLKTVYDMSVEDDESYITQGGIINHNTTSNLIKRMFVPPPGHLILEVDYGQAELRVVAEIANDKAMIDIFERGYNIHVATACKAEGKMNKYDYVKDVLKKDPDNLKGKEYDEWLFWTKRKKRAKVINFGILYGQSARELATTLSEPGEIVTTEEAQQFKDDWLELYPGVKQWFKDQRKFLEEHGFVYNVFGRKRRLESIWSDEMGIINKAVRDSINAPIQGAASDFTQLSSIIIQKRIKEGKLILTRDKKYQYQAYTVHDSIGYYIQPEFIHKAVPEIVSICSNPETKRYFGFEMKKVNMKVSAEIGKNWGDLRGYSEEEDYNKWLN